MRSSLMPVSLNVVLALIRLYDIVIYETEKNSNYMK